MQKLETINTKQIVTESVETKQVITESVSRRVVESAEPAFTSSIARSLAEEFGYELDEAGPNDPNATAATAANTKTMQDARAKKDAASGQVVGSGTTPAPAGQAASPAAAPAAGAPAAGGVANPYQGADAAKFAAMSPADQAWLTKGGGKPDINDQFILARAPNKGAPAKATGAVLDPTGPASGKESDMMAAADQADADLGAAMTANAAQADAIKSGAQDDVTGVDKAVAANAADDAKRAANPWPADKNAIIAFQKANGLTADGLIGPKTMAALQKSGATPPSGFQPAAPKAAPAAAPAPGQKSLPAGVTPSTAGGGRGGVNPTAPAPAAPTNPKVAELDAKIAGLKKYPQMNANIIARLEKEKAGLSAPTAAPATESIQTHDDQILAIIRNIRVG